MRQKKTDEKKSLEEDKEPIVFCKENVLTAINKNLVSTFGMRKFGLEKQLETMKQALIKEINGME